MLKRTITIPVVATLMATSLQAATLTNVSGKVYVNAGAGFVPVYGDTTIAPGTRVRVGEGTAVIDYGGGCAFPLGSEQMALVVSEYPCKGSYVIGAGTDGLLVPGLIVAGIGGVTAAIVLSQSNSSPASP